MMSWFKRLRHGRGFGVHSPFAYRFIIEVLRQRLPYYDYARITDHDERLWYRVLARFNPATVSAPARMMQVALMACPDVRQADADTAQIVAYDHCPDDGQLLRVLERHEVVVYLQCRLTPRIRKLVAEYPQGMVFDNERSLTIVVITPGLPHQVFPTRF